jgi:hypothetical protein
MALIIDVIAFIEVNMGRKSHEFRLMVAQVLNILPIGADANCRAHHTNLVLRKWPHTAFIM